MVQFRVRGLPPIKLVDLLKKRKTNLKDFLKETGIATYTTLETKCGSMGVSPPTEAEFQDALGPVVSSPQEGIIVLDSPTLTNDAGNQIKIEDLSSDPVAEPSAVPAEPVVVKKKSTRKE